MKLSFPKIDVETSRQFEDESFGLGDVRVIMELLSSKIYARPKYIIVQEVASNARDANREAGRENVPIQIKLPSRLDDNLIIADSGPGISPKRMSEVFLKYGNSTKRADNVLTGGFGIGAKTPFTYTDTFNVITVTNDEDGVRRERTYIAHKASNGFAKMALVDTKESTDDTGTAISFAVEKADFDDFIYATRDCCRYWKVRPKVTGVPNWKWPEENVLHKGKGWKLTDERRNSKVLVDGIPYTLRLATVFGDDRSSETYRVLSSHSIRMYFDVGEIEVTATREDLDYKDKTINAIKKRASDCLDELRKEVNKKVSKAKNLWEASIQWHENSGTYSSFLVKPKYNGKNLLEHNFSSQATVYTKDLKGYKGKDSYLYMRDHLKVTSFVRDSNGVISSKKRYGNSVDRHVYCRKNILIIEDDEGKARPNRLRLQTIFDQNPNIAFATVILFKTPESRLFAEQVWNWSEFPVTKLSSYPKAKRQKSKSGGARTINAIKVLKRPNHRGWTKQWEPDNTRSPEDTQGGTYIILKNGHPILPNGQRLSKDGVERIFKMVEPQATVYGVLYKYKKKISSSWTHIMDKAEREFKVREAKPTVATYLKWGHTNDDAGLGHNIAEAIRKSTNLVDKDLKKFLDDAEVASKAQSDYNAYRNLGQVIGKTIKQPGNEFEKFKKAILDKYPLLAEYDGLFGRRYFNTTKSRNNHDNILKEELIFYLNSKFNATLASKGVSNANP